jgi:hypothetical protein
MENANDRSLASSGKFESLILSMRGEKVILDADLVRQKAIISFFLDEEEERLRYTSCIL